MTADSYRRYMLGLLMCILAFNYTDRLALSLVLQDIKLDLHLSDTQLGMLTGIAFAIFYSVMGIPLARWADTGNRKTVISLTVALWSAAVALCAVAGSFFHLLLIRIGVAIGEAGCIPPAHSLIAEYFGRAERPRAVARYMLGQPLSVIIGFFFAGWLNQYYGWRTTFVVLGVPGLALAVLAALTLREPRSKRAAGSEAVRDKDSAAEVPSMRKVAATLWSSRAFRHLLLGFSVIYFFGFGIGKWQPAFFVRSHGMQTGELGTWFAVIFGVVGLVATYLGGEIAVRHAAGKERLQLRALAAAFAVFGVVQACVYLSRDRNVAFALLALATVAYCMSLGPLFSTIQTLVPERMRALSIAFIYFVANLIGMGLGPLAAGALSDAWRPTLGEESLRYALVALSPGYLWAAWHLWRAGNAIEIELSQRSS